VLLWVVNGPGIIEQEEHPNALTVHLLPGLSYCLDSGTGVIPFMKSSAPEAS